MLCFARASKGLPEMKQHAQVNASNYWTHCCITEAHPKILILSTDWLLSPHVSVWAYENIAITTPTKTCSLPSFHLEQLQPTSNINDTFKTLQWGCTMQNFFWWRIHLNPPAAKVPQAQFVAGSDRTHFAPTWPKLDRFGLGNQDEVHMAAWETWPAQSEIVKTLF